MRRNDLLKPDLMSEVILLGFGALTRGNTGTPSGDCSQDQLGTRERWAGPSGVAERSVVLTKPGNAGGGKGPQSKTDARSDEGHGD